MLLFSSFFISYSPFYFCLQLQCSTLTLFYSVCMSLYDIYNLERNNYLGDRWFRFGNMTANCRKTRGCKQIAETSSIIYLSNNSYSPHPHNNLYYRCSFLRSSTWTLFFCSFRTENLSYKETVLCNNSIQLDWMDVRRNFCMLRDYMCLRPSISAVF